MKKSLIYLLAFLSIGLISIADYPYDGYSHTGIRRLKYVERVQKGEVSSKSIHYGALRPLSSVKLNLDRARITKSELGVPEADSELQNQISKLFKGMNVNYSLTLLDMTNPNNIRYADHRPSAQYQPGSVGKLVVLTAFFTALEEVFPNFNDRLDLLRTKQIKAGRWAMSDHHTIPVYDIESNTMKKRKVRETDVFSLYEWIDHMVSVSNNGAASVVWREAFLMSVFKEKYPSLTFEEADAYFKENKKSDLSKMAIEMVNAPLRDLGITEDEWRLGKFFTGGAGSYIPGRGGSIGTPIGLMKFVLALEEGKIVDKKTSLEMKRLLYLTDRRIRYAASKKLDSAMVYFKSGSLYKCDRVKNPNCGKYQGNVYNYMNSVAIIEHIDGTKYAVCLMSNVHNKNSAYDHLMLASKIDDIIKN